MDRYILIYQILTENNDTPIVEVFQGEEKEMHNRVNALNNIHRDKFKVNFACIANTEIKYIPYGIVTEYMPRKIALNEL